MVALPNASFQWWLERLPRHNLVLATAGILAFIAYLPVGSVLLSGDEGFEVTFFTILLQGIGYLVMMVIANCCHMIGPVSESILRPDDARKYRERWHSFGCRFSFSLPFSVPVLVLVLAMFSRW